MFFFWKLEGGGIANQRYLAITKEIQDGVCPHEEITLMISALAGKLSAVSLLRCVISQRELSMMAAGSCLALKGVAARPKMPRVRYKNPV